MQTPPPRSGSDTAAGNEVPSQGNDAVDDYVFPGGCLFISAFSFVFGLAFLAPMAILPYWHAWQARDWQPVTCRIQDIGIHTLSDEDGETHRIRVSFEYEVGGHAYTGDRYDFAVGYYGDEEAKARAIQGLSRGTLTTCWVNPDDPGEAVVERRAGVPPFASLMTLPLVLFGLFGFYAVTQGLLLHLRDRWRAWRKARNPYDVSRYGGG